MNVDIDAIKYNPKAVAPASSQSNSSSSLPSTPNTVPQYMWPKQERPLICTD